MSLIFVAMEDTVLRVDRTDGWQSDAVLSDAPCRCLAADAGRPERVYCGTADRGLLHSEDGGASWHSVRDGIPHAYVTAVAVSTNERGRDGAGVVYAGTEPSAVFRSEDGGKSWQELDGLLDLPSATSWSFPPRPDTHHVRWIGLDPATAGRLFVAIEAGALVTYDPGDQDWRDRVAGGPYDTHTLAFHPGDPRRIHSAAGDGYYESRDGGATWQQPQTGLEHRYAWSCAIDADADTVVISAARGPGAAHSASRAESYIYRRSADAPWQAVANGLPSAAGTTVSSIASDPAAAGVLYAANNHGVFRSADAGASWERLDIDWPERFRGQRAAGIVVAPHS